MIIRCLKLIYGNLLLVTLRTTYRHKTIKLTCKRKHTAGLGNYLLSYYSTISFCEYMGFEYVHTPFAQIAHNYDQNPHYDRMWEELSGLKELIKDIPLSKEKGDAMLVRRSIFKPRYEETIVNSTTSCFEFWHLRPGVAKKFAAKARQTYKKSISDKSAQHCADNLNIGIHIRRGDVDAGNVRLFVDLEIYQNIIRQLHQSLNGINYRIHIFSQGINEDWDSLTDENTIFHLDEDVFSTFNLMAACDILIVSKSTFSICAGMLSNAIILYVPGEWTYLKHWIKVDGKTGEFSTKSLKSRLKNHGMLDLYRSEV